MSKFKSLRLSHSAASKYQLCPESYRLHYIEKLRPKLQSAALLFGSALDNAITHMLTENNKPAEEVFLYYWRFQQVNGKQTYIPDFTEIVYANTDFDQDLLIEEDLIKIKEKAIKHNLIIENDNPIEFFKFLQENKKSGGFEKFSEDEKKFYNFVNWFCMRRKAPLMLEAVKRDIMPHIKEVISVQEDFNLRLNKEAEFGEHIDNDKDSIYGKIDLVARLQNGKIAILDFKTSAMEYDADSAATSPQLAIYAKALEHKYKTKTVGFLVLRKAISKNRKKVCSVCQYDGSGARHKTCNNDANGKRCGGEWIETINPKCTTQIIIDEVSERALTIVRENFNVINKNIRKGEFHRNLNSCHNTYGSRCVYFSRCWKDHNEGLEKIK